MNLNHRTHDERDDLDGWRTQLLSPVARYAPASRTVLEAGPQLGAVDVSEDHGPRRVAGIGIGMSRALDNGISASFQRQRYRADGPLFAVRREDETAWLSAKVLHRSFQLDGFAPCIGHFYERRFNIALCGAAITA